MNKEITDIQKKLDGKNIEQQEAIKAPMETNILISAGAGSGKTKTLSTRVAVLIEKGLIEPSELLVLTFTDNAAHEMKERIIAEIKDDEKGKDTNKADQMYSAHIQTFDSFASYLVKRYSSKLGIGDNVLNAPENIIDAKKNSLLEEVFKEYYSSEEKRKRITKSLLKFCLRSDNDFKQIVAGVHESLDKLTPNGKKDFIQNYDEKYLSEDFFKSCLDQFVNESKKTIERYIYKLFVKTKFKKFYEDDEDYHLNDIETLFKSNYKIIFNQDVKKIDFQLDSEEDDLLLPIYEGMKNLLSYDSYDFVLHVKNFFADNKELEGLDKSRKKNISLVLFKEFCKENFFTYCSSFSDTLEEEWNKFISFKDDIHLILDIIQEVDKRLFEYKKMNNFFTFQDVQSLALELLSSPKYKDVAEEVRTRFKYIMVDEYQDTNDFQEEFINSLLEKNEKGETSHIFCVGDAKQSIYAFRNSNVQLFRNRQNEYLLGPDEKQKVIAMNKNYRSAQRLLNDINYIFKNYMTLSHGSISYLDEMEQLKYDTKVDLYGKTPYTHFGIKRIVSKSGINDDYKEEYGSKSAYCKEWEARAIIQDIQDKIDSKFEVYDCSLKESKKTRPCKYSDFAILTRSKSGFELYQSLFNHANIPLNVSIENDLRSIDSIIVLQSIVKLIDAINKNASDNEKAHYFVSIARSYAYEYSDQKIYDLLNYDCTKKKYEAKKVDLSFIKEDPLWISIESFVKEYKNSSFSDIFLAIINRFHIIENLNKVGNVEDNVAKIESIYSMVLAKEESGEGLSDFVELLENLDKYSLDLSDSSVYQCANAVDMMSIHASKGLERKIVYMPYSYNNIGKMSNPSNEPYLFDRRFGILLPNLVLPEGKAEEGVYNLPYRFAFNAPSENGTEHDEHVRLFYVALTRAGNALYIVGDTLKSEESDIKAETLYGMLNYCPHYPLFDENYISKAIKGGLLNKDAVDFLNTLIDKVKNISSTLETNDLSADHSDLNNEFYKEFYVDYLKKILDERINDIFNVLLEKYVSKYLKGSYDVLEMETLKEICEYLNNSKLDSSLDGTEEEAEEKPNVNRKNKDEALIAFGKSLRKAVLAENKDKKVGWEELGYKGEKTVKRSNFIRSVVSCFAKYKDNCETLFRTSYKTSDYEDECYSLDVSFEKTTSVDRDEEGKKTVRRIGIVSFDGEIPFKERIKARASKKKSIKDEENEGELQNKMSFGIKLHRLLELLDFKNPDLSYIQNPKEKEIIQKLLDTPLMKEALAADEVYSEYGFFDEVNRTTGFIDLMFVKGGHYTIVDYKTKNIEDEAYVDQLRTYQRNIKDRFDLEDSDISLYLLSIIDGESKEIPTTEIWQA